MTRIGIFTSIGNREFVDFVSKFKVNRETPFPTQILYQPPFSVAFAPEIEIEDKIFRTRFEFGAYLTSLFESVPRDTLIKNEGLWNWLALFFIEQLIPLNSKGKRDVGEIARYVYNPHYTSYYLHLVAASWDIYNKFGEDSKLFLFSPMNKTNKFIRELACRQNIISNKNLIKAVQMLYWKENEAGHEGIKKGSISKKKPGNLYRFIAVMNQFDTNFDLYAMKPDDFIRLLPAEFDIWKSKQEKKERSLISRITH